MLQSLSPYELTSFQDRHSVSNTVLRHHIQARKLNEKFTRTTEDSKTIIPRPVFTRAHLVTRPFTPRARADITQLTRVNKLIAHQDLCTIFSPRHEEKKMKKKRTRTHTMLTLQLTVDLDALALGDPHLLHLDSALDVIEYRGPEQQVREEEHQQDQPLLLRHSPCTRHQGTTKIDQKKK